MCENPDFSQSAESMDRRFGLARRFGKICEWKVRRDEMKFRSLRHLILDAFCSCSVIHRRGGVNAGENS